MTPLQFMILSQAIIFVLGWPLEWTEIIIIFVPIFLPLLKHFNIDPILWGTLVFVNLQAAFLSPPVAMSAFYLKGVSPPHVTLNQIFAGMMPYMLIVILCMVIMYLWPGMTLWLPSAILYGGTRARAYAEVLPGSSKCRTVSDEPAFIVEVLNTASAASHRSPAIAVDRQLRATSHHTSAALHWGTRTVAALRSLRTFCDNQIYRSHGQLVWSPGGDSTWLDKVPPLVRSNFACVYRTRYHDCLRLRSRSPPRGPPRKRCS